MSTDAVLCVVRGELIDPPTARVPLRHPKEQHTSGSRSNHPSTGPDNCSTIWIQASKFFNLE